MAREISVVVAYDIRADNRRTRIAATLSSHGFRVQYSVFECTFASEAAYAALRRRLKELVDPDDDQIRIYPLSGAGNRREVLGNRSLEERRDYWIV